MAKAPLRKVDVKVLLQGDTHGHAGEVRAGLSLAQRYECELMIILGDYGWGWDWNDYVHRDDFTAKVSKAVAAYEIPVWWIDGNHENFDRLEAVGAFGADAPVEVAPGVTYIPRGTVQTVGETRVLFIGGAYSVDKKYRTPHVSWWPQEEITGAEADRCLDAGQVDVVVSHDVCDTGFRAAMRLALEDHRDNALELDHLVWKNDQAFPEAKYNRRTLEGIFESARPRDWYHGHYHSSYETEAQGTVFHGLAHEGELGSRLVVDW